MGNKQQCMESRIKIASLNYSGIMASPYEFYRHRENDSVIDHCTLSDKLFVHFANQEFDGQFLFAHDVKNGGSSHDGNFEWKIGFIDKQWHQNRHCPLYDSKVGIRNNKIFEKKKHFLDQWQKKESKRIDQNKKIISNSFSKLKKPLKSQPNLNLKKKELCEKIRQKISPVMTAKCMLEFLPSKYTQQIQNQIHKQLDNDESSYSQHFIEFVYNCLRIELQTFDYIAYKSIVSAVCINSLISVQQMNQQFSETVIDKLNQIEQFLDHQNSTLNSQTELVIKYRLAQLNVFNKSFLNPTKKSQKTIKFITDNKIDVMFIQQADQFIIKQLQKKLNNYKIIKPFLKQSQLRNQMSITLIRVQAFGGKLRNLCEQNLIFFKNYIRLVDRGVSKKKIEPEVFEEMNINYDTVVQAIGNMIFFSSHFSSRKSRMLENVSQMIGLLDKMKKYFPNNQIIFGGDLNTNGLSDVQRMSEMEGIDFSGFTHRYHVYPSLSMLNASDNLHGTKEEESSVQDIRGVESDKTALFTTCKTRSYMQAQRNKANEDVMIVKDYIISSLKLKNPQVIMLVRQSMDGSNSFVIDFHSKDYDVCGLRLPNEEHPYDHFIIMAEIDLPKDMFHVYEPEYLKRYCPQDLTEEQLAEIDQKIEHFPV